MSTPPVAQVAVNVSEGRRRDVLDALVRAARAVPGVALADWSADPDHNRAVLTLLGPPAVAARAVLALAREAVARIDLREHVGVHPRLGAVDVVPFTPVRDVTMGECVQAAEAVGQALAGELGLPVYLYEAATRPGRLSDLPAIRRGGFEGLLAGAMTGTRSPDFGPARPHPTAGAAVVGARGPLVAYNVELDAADAAPARRAAAALRVDRHTHPALTGVRALGLPLPSRGRSQVSMNVTQPSLAPLPGVFDYVCSRAAAEGVRVVSSEVIGLLPRASLAGCAPERICWPDARPEQFLEWWLERMAGPEGAP